MKILSHILILLFILSSCKGKPSGYLEEALLFARANRPKLEKVLAHYSVNPADSLKYRAAVFLIEKTGYGYKTGLRKSAVRYDLLDPESFERTGRADFQL